EFRRVLFRSRSSLERDSRRGATISVIMTRYQVLNGGEPGGAFSIKSTNGMTYPIEITANINTIQSPQRSVHFGVGNASSSGSPIGNSVSPLGALNMR